MYGFDGVFYCSFCGAVKFYGFKAGVIDGFISIKKCSILLYCIFLWLITDRADGVHLYGRADGHDCHDCRRADDVDDHHVFGGVPCAVCGRGVGHHHDVCHGCDCHVHDDVCVHRAWHGLHGRDERGGCVHVRDGRVHPHCA